MFLNYCGDYAKNDDLFAARWKHSRQSVKPKIISLLETFHNEVDEIHWGDWTLYPIAADSYLEDVIGFVDAVHAPLQAFSRDSQQYYDYWSVNYNTHCHKWSGIVDNCGAQFIYFSKYGSAGKSHDFTCLVEEGVDVLLNRLNKYLVCDRIYDGADWLLSPYRGGNFTASQKSWNKEISSQRSKVENCFSRFKNFSIMKHDFRGTLNDHRRWGYVVASLVNIDLRIRPIRESNSWFFEKTTTTDLNNLSF